MVLLDVVYLSMNRKKILRKCHSSPYGGHHMLDTELHTRYYNLISIGLLSLKMPRKFVLSCDECQRVGNIGRHEEMPMKLFTCY